MVASGRNHGQHSNTPTAIQRLTQRSRFGQSEIEHATMVGIALTNLYCSDCLQKAQELAHKQKLPTLARDWVSDTAVASSSSWIAHPCHLLVNALLLLPCFVYVFASPALRELSSERPTGPVRQGLCVSCWLLLLWFTASTGAGRERFARLSQYGPQHTADGAARACRQAGKT